MKDAIYPGTFDPITYGHLDMVTRATRIFDRLVVAVGHNPKKHPVFTVDERVDMIRTATADNPRVEVTQYDGLLVQFARERGINTVVRSLRTVTEFELELSTAVANRQLYPDLEIAFLMPSLEYTYLSSTIVRELAEFGGDISSFVPAFVAEQLRDRIGKR
jgi:pantetheine-phosphate adenylyltransferase